MSVAAPPSAASAAALTESGPPAASVMISVGLRQPHLASCRATPGAECDTTAGHARYRTRNKGKQPPMPQQDKPAGLVVIEPVRDWACAECAGTGGFLRMDDSSPLCLSCADLDHLVFLPAGDAALTRRAAKASSLSAVVVRWSRTRKRYERQGVLVEEQALARAEQQCLSDQDARMRRRERDRERRACEDERFRSRLAEEIRQLFPGCPPDRATAIARHTGLRGSGRVGRSAAARALDTDAITLAVTASIRHQDTGYDALLMGGLSRSEARERVRDNIDRVLTAWRELPRPGRPAVPRRPAGSADRAS